MRIERDLLVPVLARQKLGNVLDRGDLLRQNAPLVQTAGRTATVCRVGAAPVVLVEADAEGAAAPLSGHDGLGTLVYEPDRAIIRAGLTGALARVVDGRELDSGVGYVTSDRVMDLSWAHRYRVLEAMPWNLKALRAWLRDHDVGRVTIKKRGVALDPDAVRKQLRTKGAGEATLILTRIGSQPQIIVVQPA